MSSVEEQMLADRVIDYYANRLLPSWEQQGKVHAPRVVLGKLYRSRDVAEVNDYLKAQRPWAGAGSDWDFGFMGFKGDYDFTLATLVPVLYLFGEDPEVLYPETREHLLHVLLVEQEEPGWELTGGEPRLTVPGSFGLVPETENHILMTEGSRYLKNQWLREREGFEDPEYDNLANGLETWLLEYLGEILDFDFHEFNSIPYEGYALQGVLNLAVFASSDPVRNRAAKILDEMARRYVVGSLDFRRYPPFNRQGQKASDRGFGDDRLTAIMKVWADDPIEQEAGTSPRHVHQMLPAAVLDYRPPAEVLGALLAHRKPYFVRFGRGRTGSPEIYSGGPGYLISSGGSSRSLENTARQTVLFLEDGARDILYQSFYLEAVGDREYWNHTGVFKNFACGPGAVYIPSRYSAEAVSENWMIFRPYPEGALHLAVHNGEGIGVLALFPDYGGAAEALAAALENSNPDPVALRSRFRFPAGPELAYDVEAGRNTWVIESVDGEPVDRFMGDWPRPRQALEGALDWFRVKPVLPGVETQVEASVFGAPIRPSLYYIKLPPERHELTVDSSGFSGSGTGLVVAKGLPGKSSESTAGTFRINHPARGLYWIGAYASEADQESRFRVVYEPEARTFEEWDLWKRGAAEAGRRPLKPEDYPVGSNHPWWVHYAFAGPGKGGAISIEPAGVFLRLRGDAEDLIYNLEESLDLRTWTEVEGVEKVDQEGPWAVHRVDVNVPEGRLFLRLRAEFRKD